MHLLAAGEGRVDHLDPSESSSQQLTDSLPPFVLVTATSVSASVGAIHQSVPRGGTIRASRTSESSPTRGATAPPGPMQQQVEMMRSIHQQQLEDRGIAGLGARAEEQRASAEDTAQAVAALDGGSGLLGAMGSPAPRPRMVTFLDEAQGPPERVRLAPTELFNQMQSTLKTCVSARAAGDAKGRQGMPLRYRFRYPDWVWP